MNIYENGYNSLVNSDILYHDVILLFDNGEKLYSSKYFLSLISPFFEKMFKYDNKEDNIYHLPYKKLESVRIVIALCFPFINLNNILNEMKINANIIKIMDEWCMKELLENIENFFLQKYEQYNLAEMFYFSDSCNFNKVTEILINNMTIKKYDLIKESKVWEKINNNTKLTLSESVMNNIKKRKFNYYD